jgi:hypothetical protein
VLACKHIFGRPRCHRSARLHEHDPVTEARGERQIVQRHHHRAARGGKRGEVPEKGQLVRGVEAGGRLVGQQHARLLRQRTRNQHRGRARRPTSRARAGLQMRHVHGGECRAMACASAALSPAPIGW